MLWEKRKRRFTESLEIVENGAIDYRKEKPKESCSARGIIGKDMRKTKVKSWKENEGNISPGGKNTAITELIENRGKRGGGSSGEDL